jgi:hypothetical protein
VTAFTIRRARCRSLARGSPSHRFDAGVGERLHAEAAYRQEPAVVEVEHLVQPVDHQGFEIAALHRHAILLARRGRFRGAAYRQKREGGVREQLLATRRPHAKADIGRMFEQFECRHRVLRGYTATSFQVISLPL